jgi:hypothetical protein
LAVVAAFLGANQIELFAQQVQQCCPGLHAQLAVLAIQRQGNGMLCEGLWVRRTHGKSLTVVVISALNLRLWGYDLWVFAIVQGL